MKHQHVVSLLLRECASLHQRKATLALLRYAHDETRLANEATETSAGAKKEKKQPQKCRKARENKPQRQGKAYLKCCCKYDVPPCVKAFTASCSGLGGKNWDWDVPTSRYSDQVTGCVCAKQPCLKRSFTTSVSRVAP